MHTEIMIEIAKNNNIATEILNPVLRLVFFLMKNSEKINLIRAHRYYVQNRQNNYCYTNISQIDLPVSERQHFCKSRKCNDKTIAEK